MIHNRRALVILLTLLCLGGFGCSGSLSGRPVDDDATVVRGAGSTFAAPLYREWGKKYRSVNPTVRIEYDSVGSGEGEKRFIEGIVDFGATDATFTTDQSSRVEGGAVAIPVATGAIVLAYNAEGLPDGLKLSREVYVDILLGHITEWNDSRIASANPGASLPKLSIERVVRLDSSGTTHSFTSHLAAISKDWRDGPGVGKVVKWPGRHQSFPGNDRVAGMIKQIYGSIGYVEYGTARATGLRMATLENKQGKFVVPSIKSAQEAIPSFGAEVEESTLQDPSQPEAYPIVTRTWLLAYRSEKKSGKSKEVRDFVRWCLTNGQDACESLGYVRLSPGVASLAIQRLDETAK